MSTVSLDPYRRQCRHCGADIVWATSSATGAPMPVNYAPSDTRGNILLVHDGQKLVAGVLGRNQAGGARDRGTTLYTSHYVECRGAK